MTPGHLDSLPDTAGDIRRIGILALNDFPMVTVSSAIEVLRVANKLSGHDVYTWEVIAPQSGIVRACDGVSQINAVGFQNAGKFDLILVCASCDQPTADAQVLEMLHESAKSGTAIGGVCGGAMVLICAGLMDGYKCATLATQITELQSSYSTVEFLPRAFIFDRNRITCAQRIAIIDVMLTMVGARLDSNIATQVSNHLGASPTVSSGAKLRHPALQRVIALMEENLEDPLSAVELAYRSGLSLRRIQRLFQIGFGKPLTSHYLYLRLNRARTLVLYSPLSLTEISVATGFTSLAHFSRSYRARYGCAPSNERIRLRQVKV